MEKALGKFIVIEGIDGCGGETQTNFLSDFFSKNGHRVNKLSYPDYDGPIGNLLHHYLHRKYEFNLGAKALIYFTDFVKDKEKMQEFLKSGNILIADRYFTSTMVYQHLEGLEMEKLLELAKIFELPKPDLCIYVKISAETSIKRKVKEKEGNLDRHEEDNKFLSDVASTYDKIAKDNIFCDWAVIDGEKSIEEVSKKILSVINKKLGI